MSDEPVTIAKFLTLGEAKLAQGKLISAGISAFVCDENMQEVACCPECESLEIREVAGANPRQIALWSAAMPFPDPPAPETHRWKCLACGYQWREAEE